MSHQQVLNAVGILADQAPKEATAQEKLHTANAAVLLAQAYCQMKEVEIHEKFHNQPEGGFTLPGEGPLDKGSN